MIDGLPPATTAGEDCGVGEAETFGEAVFDVGGRVGVVATGEGEPVCVGAGVVGAGVVPVQAVREIIRNPKAILRSSLFKYAEVFLILFLFLPMTAQFNRFYIHVSETYYIRTTTAKGIPFFSS